MTTEQEKTNEEEEYKLPTPADIKEWYDLALSYYTKDHKRMRLLDSTDRGYLWKALKAKFPAYQILPDTNYVTYVKNNIVASIYTVTKKADIEPTSEEDVELTENLNIAMDRIWNLSKVGYYQFKAGERTALLNYGLTQVGWDDTLSAGSGNAFYRGNVTLKNINPIKFVRDPFASCLDEAGWCMTFDNYAKTVFQENPNYKEEFEKYLIKANQDRPTTEVPEMDETARIPKGAAKDYHTLSVVWIKDDGKVHEVHLVDWKHILYSKKDIKPSIFPIAELYCNEPAEALVGSSEPSKIFANNVAYNLMDSIALTAEYKNQRPPKFISSQSGLNIQSFAKHGDEADRTFVVNGRADQAVHYHQFPQISPALSSLKFGLHAGIETVSGIDGRYTGRDTGSITTTGGTEEMLNRVTLIDTPKITMYEDYCKRLTKLILANFIEFAPKRKFFYQKPNTTKWKTIEIDFAKLDSDTLFNYSMNVSSELPKNKQRLAAMANMLMEKQMQYQQQGNSIQLITEEEWLMFQDLPRKEYMLERMGVQRMQDVTEEVSQVLFQYTDLIKQGVSPEDAIMGTAHSLKQARAGESPEQGPIPGAVQDGQVPGGDPMDI